MTSNSDVVSRWHQVVRGEASRLIGSWSNNVKAKGDTVYSYGHHFPMAEAIRREPGGAIEFYLLNSDGYSNTTTHHQSIVRSELSDETTILLPFSALSAAGIVHSTIEPVEILDDRYDKIEHTAMNLEDVPEYQRTHYTWDPDTRQQGHEAIKPQPDSLYHWTTERHWMGSSVFSAEVQFIVQVEPCSIPAVEPQSVESREIAARKASMDLDEETWNRWREKDGTRYTLDANGAVLARSDGPEGWDYSGEWLIVGFKTRWNANRTISLGEALSGVDTGQGWVLDLDHGRHRLWGSPSGRRLAHLKRIVEDEDGRLIVV